MAFSSLKSYLLPALVATTLSCTTQNETPTDNGCTDPKLVMMSHDVGNSIALAINNMAIITLAPHTTIQHGNFRTIEQGFIIDFNNRAVLVNDGNAMTNGNTTLCDQKADGEIDCYVGQAKDFKENPVMLTNFRTVILKDNTISISAPVDTTHPAPTEWITAEEPGGVCGVFSRYGESSEWCADPYSGAHPSSDVARESACIQDFNSAKDRIKQQLARYNARLVD